MNKSKVGRIRLFSLCIVALLLIVCTATILVACCDLDDKVQPLNSAIIANITEHFVGYAISDNCQDFKYECVVVGEDGIHEGFFYEMYGEGCRGYISLHSNSSVAVVFYDNKENAKAAHESFISEGVERNSIITLRANLILIEYTKGLYDIVMSSTSNDEYNQSKEYEFAKTSLATVLSQDLYWCYLQHEFYVSERGLISDYSLDAHPTVGNCAETYLCQYNYTQVEEYQAEIGTTYTDDSYAKVEDDVFYARLKDKAGFEFKENDAGGYTVTDYRFNTVEGGNAIIPSTYNGKPVTTISRSAFSGCSGLTCVTIPTSITNIEGLPFTHSFDLTDIIFQGTKAQWNAISKNEYWYMDSRNFIIHCTDGDLSASGEEV